MGRPVVDLLGKRFGRLTVVGRGESTKDKKAVWVCKCDCGNTKAVPASSLKSGHTRSCGCLFYDSRKIVAEKQKGEKSHFYKHGLSDSRINSIYRGMKKRCYDKNEPAYRNYGGRGIKVCDEWLSDFMSFYRWAMGNGYNDDLSIDRIDVNGDYCPENCRWTDRKTQANNTRTNRKYSLNGETHTIADWARIYGVERKLVYKRISLGWTISESLLIPKNISRKEWNNLKYQVAI